jgi:hypothetical protein
MTHPPRPAALLSTLAACCLLLTLTPPTAHGMAQQVGREQEIVNLNLGQRILVDDGTCPAGQIKEVSGARMGPNGIERARKCIPRKKK